MESVPMELLLFSAVGRSDQVPANLTICSSRTYNIFSFINSSLHLLFGVPFVLTTLFNFLSVSSFKERKGPGESLLSI